jgi:hypothetical protein
MAVTLRPILDKPLTSTPVTATVRRSRTTAAEAVSFITMTAVDIAMIVAQAPAETGAAAQGQEAAITVVTIAVITVATTTAAARDPATPGLAAPALDRGKDLAAAATVVHDPEARVIIIRGMPGRAAADLVTAAT